MNKELKYLLEELKDTTNDYVGTNGCLYQDLLREELNLLLDYIKNLEQLVKKQKEVIDKAIEYINENVYEDDNGCGDYWWEIADKGELLKILENKEVSE